MYQFNKYVATFAEQYHPVTAGIIAVNIFVNNSGSKVYVLVYFLKK